MAWHECIGGHNLVICTNRDVLIEIGWEIHDVLKHLIFISTNYNINFIHLYVADNSHALFNEFFSKHENWTQFYKVHTYYFKKTSFKLCDNLKYLINFKLL